MVICSSKRRPRRAERRDKLFEKEKKSEEEKVDGDADDP